MEFDNLTLIEVSDHTDLRFHDEDLDLLVKTIKPKLLLKKAFGAYKKKGS